MESHAGLRNRDDRWAKSLVSDDVEEHIECSARVVRRAVRLVVIGAVDVPRELQGGGLVSAVQCAEEEIATEMRVKEIGRVAILSAPATGEYRSPITSAKQRE